MGRPDLYRAVAELGQFFRELCSRNIRIDALEHLRDKIPTILCDLEKIYPPALFDVMVHLAVHLPDEALLRGPVQYGWMYPIERRCRCQNRRISGRGSRTVRLGRMVTGGKGHKVLPRFGPSRWKYKSRSTTRSERLNPRS